VVQRGTKICPRFWSESINAGNLYPENCLISSLNDNFKRKETPEMVIWSIVDKYIFILDRIGRPGFAGPEIPKFWAVERSSAARYFSCHRLGAPQYFLSLCETTTSL
jgi:hypothetical protein